MTDFGLSNPTAGTNDIFQVLTNGNVGNFGINYYTDSGMGQTFTTGTNSSGYYLNSLYIKMGSINGGSGGGGVGTWTLRFYSLTNAYAGTATLIGTFVNANVAPAITLNHWTQWQGPAITFQPNTVYGYNVQNTDGYIQGGNSTNKPTYYSGGQSAGQAVAIAAGGTVTYGGTTNYNATFLVNLAPGGSPLILAFATSVTNGAGLCRHTDCRECVRAGCQPELLLAD